ncbi:hypothetical protein FRB99_001847, partial [Tulasnella sp. 403]
HALPHHMPPPNPYAGMKIGEVVKIDYDLPENQYLVVEGQIVTVTTPSPVRKPGTSTQVPLHSSPDVSPLPAPTKSKEVSPSLSAIFNTSLDSEDFIQCLDQVEAAEMNIQKQGVPPGRTYQQVMHEEINWQAQLAHDVFMDDVDPQMK